MRTAALILALCFVTSSTAQSRLDRDLRAPVDDIVADAASATVSVHSDGRRVAYGVVVDATGWVVTKHSVLGDRLRVRSSAGTKAARIVESFPEYDLALLRVDATLTPTKWRDTGNLPLKPGQIALSLGRGRAIGFGVVGVAPRNIAGETGFLGVYLEEPEGGSGARVRSVQMESAAEKAGVETGDVIVGVDDERVRNPEDLIRIVRAAGAGSRLDLDVLRKGRQRAIPLVLGSREEDPDDLRLSGGELSGRRSGFKLAFQHDGGLIANDCGGPVVDLDGLVSGVNVARAGRVRTYAVPANEVRALVEPIIRRDATPPSGPRH